MFEENSKPYSWDLPTFKELGLEPFNAPHATETYVGEVDNKYWTIKIWVDCMPAQFWKFEIFFGFSEYYRKRSYRDAEQETIVESEKGIFRTRSFTRCCCKTKRTQHDF